MGVSKRIATAEMLAGGSRFSFGQAFGLSKSGRQVFVITGDKELDKKLRKLDSKVGKKLARTTVRNVMKRIVLPEAKARVPVDTGELDDSLKVRALKRSRGRIGMQVQAGAESGHLFQGEQFYAGFVELGTKHIQAQPFLRPALYGNEKRIRAEFISDLNKVLDEQRTA